MRWSWSLRSGPAYWVRSTQSAVFRLTLVNGFLKGAKTVPFSLFVSVAPTFLLSTVSHKRPNMLCAVSWPISLWVDPPGVEERLPFPRKLAEAIPSDGPCDSARCEPPEEEPEGWRRMCGGRMMGGPPMNPGLCSRVPRAPFPFVSPFPVLSLHPRSGILPSMCVEGVWGAFG